VLQPDDFDFLGEAETRATGPAGLEEAVTAEAEALLAEPDSDGLHAQILERVERPLLEAVLRETDGNQIRAAARLGINRNTLRKKIAELSVRLPRRP
jgi:two-component system nitrogen regulation response regulator GlnG